MRHLLADRQRSHDDFLDHVMVTHARSRQQFRPPACPNRLATAQRQSRVVGRIDHHRPLYQVLVERLRKEGLAGATVVRGIEGFGRASLIHTASILRMSEDLPIVITVVDKEERIDSILPIIDEMVEEGLVIMENVDVITYRSGNGDSP